MPISKVKAIATFLICPGRIGSVEGWPITCPAIIITTIIIIIIITCLNLNSSVPQNSNGVFVSEFHLDAEHTDQAEYLDHAETKKNQQSWN